MADGQLTAYIVNQRLRSPMQMTPGLCYFVYYTYACTLQMQ